MSRYLKPKIKLQKFLKFNLFLKNRYLKSKTIDNKFFKKSKISEKLFTNFYYQLKEKQKIKFIYGISDKQLFKYFINSKKKINYLNTYQNISIVNYLEFRLDNIIYRMGCGSTRSQSRQMVLHGMFLINKKLVRLPSKILEIGDYIEIRKNYNKYFIINNNIYLYKINNKIPSWIFINFKLLSCYIKRYPLKNELDFSFDEKLIINSLIK